MSHIKCVCSCVVECEAGNNNTFSGSVPWKVFISLHSAAVHTKRGRCIHVLSMPTGGVWNGVLQVFTSSFGYLERLALSAIRLFSSVYKLVLCQVSLSPGCLLHRARFSSSHYLEIVKAWRLGFVSGLCASQKGFLFSMQIRVSSWQHMART